MKLALPQVRLAAESCSLLAVDDAKERGRSAYARRAWGDAYEALSQASAEGPLDADDVERLAFSAGLTGHEDAAIEAFERLHQLRLDAGEVLRAARAAFWLAMRLFSLGGEMALASGWLARAQRWSIAKGRTASSAATCGYRTCSASRLPAITLGRGLLPRRLPRSALATGTRSPALGRTFEGRALDPARSDLGRHAASRRGDGGGDER